MCVCSSAIHKRKEGIKIVYIIHLSSRISFLVPFQCFSVLSVERALAMKQSHYLIVILKPFCNGFLYATGLHE